MKIIMLTQGYFAQVDDEDFDRVAAHSWHIHFSKGVMYARRSYRKPGTRQVFKQYMHHFILGGSGVTDHKDGNGLNNQKSNLRPSNPSLNQGNTRLRKDNTSGFKGVAPSGDMWVAKCAGLVVGRFATKEDAAAAYDAAAIARFGEHARINRNSTTH